MLIKLTTNSLEAQNYIETLKNIQCGYSYSYGFEKNDERDNTNSWSIKLFSKVEKMLFKKDLPEADKEVIDYVTQSASFLNVFFNKNEPDYIKNMTISMNVNSEFNQFLKTSIDTISHIYPKGISKFKRGVDDVAAFVDPQSKKMIIGSSLFTKESEFKNPFIDILIDKIGKEKAVAFIIFHEASHTFQATNINKYDPIWDDKISNILLYAKELNCNSEKINSITIAEELNNENIINHKNKFPIIDQKFLNELTTLEGEIYADVGAILLARNADMEKDRYNIKNISKLTDLIIEARQKEHNFGNMGLTEKEFVSNFSHFTSPGLEHLKEILETIPEKVLSQKEIFEYASQASHIGLARVIVSSTIASKSNMEQIELLLNLEDTQVSPQLPKNIDKKKTLTGFNNLKKLAGESWINRFDKNLDSIADKNIEDKIKIVWQAGLNQKLFQQLTSENENISENSLVKDKNDIIQAINDFRNNISNNSYKTKLKINM